MSSPATQKSATYLAVMARVRDLQKTASQGDKVTDVKDPTATGTVTPPTHPSEAATNAELPGGNAAGDNAPAPKSIESKQVVGTCETTEATVNGDAKDRAVDSPTAKLAADAKSALARVSALLPKAAAKEEPTTESKAKAADPTDKGKVTPSDKAGPEGLPNKGAVATAPDNGAKAAAETLASDIELSRDAYVKLASLILATEDGVKFAARVLKESRGAADAEALIANALAAQEKFASDAAAEAEGAQAAEYLFKSASAPEREFMQKMATVHAPLIAAIDARTDLSAEDKLVVKMAYGQGAMDAAAMADAPAGDLPGGESEDVGNEDILAVIEQLVQAGQIPPELAQQLIAELTGGGGEEAAVDPAAAGGAPLEAEPVGDVEEKAAAKKDPVLAFTGAHLKAASVEQKLAAEILRATLPAQAAA